MNILSHAERKELSLLFICFKRGHGMNHRGCVLVPNRFLKWFRTILRYDGNIISMKAAQHVVGHARQLIGSAYNRQSGPEQAPDFFSCSSLMQTVFAEAGIALPRYAIDQSYAGKPIDPANAPIGSLLFEGNSFPIEDPDRIIGHVAIVIGKEKMIHGCWKAKKIVEATIPERMTHACNPIPQEPCSLILIPTHLRGIQTALDLARFLQRPPI